MNHNPDTPKQFTAVPGHTRLFRRESGTYYFRAKVPPRLRKVVGKTELRISLRTKEFKRAVSAVKIESLKADRIFLEAEAKTRGESLKTLPMSDEELRWMASEAFVSLEQEPLKLGSKFAFNLDDEEREAVADNLQTDLMVLLGSRAYSQHESEKFLDDHVSEHMRKFGIIEGSDNYRRAFPLFRAAVVEHYRRSIDRVKGQTPTRGDFTNLSETSVLPERPKSSMTLGALLDEFDDYQKSSHTGTTAETYVMPIRLLREEIGEETPLVRITKQDVERVVALLPRLPVNATRRYSKMTLRQTIEAGEKNPSIRRLSPRTQKNYFVRMSAVFSYAVGEGYMSENPAKSRKLREIMRKAPRSKKRALFTDEELRKLFSAPLYTGCRDDEYGYAVEGPSRPRRGRFWVPLLGLFQGFRCNEACQLHTADVGVEEGIPCIHIRAHVQDGQKSDKRLKTEASERCVPIHPELIRLGFMEFVESRRADSSSPRLFPELPIHEGRGLYSHEFSKWFRRFVAKTCGPETKATFHSLRHHFRTALMAAEVPTEIAEALGGWSSEGSSEREYRHNQLKVLASHLKKVAFSAVAMVAR